MSKVLDSYRKWSWIAQETLAPSKPKWLHEAVCPFCRSYLINIRLLSLATLAARRLPEWWKAYYLACKLPGICPANAHGVLIWHTRVNPRIDGTCREDCALNGNCWCGKLRSEKDGSGADLAGAR